jgi:hypothetical protein
MDICNMVEPEGYDFKAVEQHYGPIPTAFQKCFVCGEPTALLICGRFTNPPEELRRLQNGEAEFIDPEATRFEEYVREHTGCSVVLPVCEFHQDGSVPQ